MQKILPVKPYKYLEQGITGCGGFSVKGILSAFGKDDKETAFDYYPPPKWGVMSSPSWWAKTLRSYGLDIELARASVNENMSDLLKVKLDEGKVLMLRVGNGYTKRGRWYWLPWQLVGHWVTIWGYDDADGVFYIYDSWIPAINNQNLPVGNIKRKFDDVVRDWQGGFPFWWRRSYLAIGGK